MTNKLTALEVMRDAPVIPVIVLHDVAHAVPLARALVAGGQLAPRLGTKAVVGTGMLLLGSSFLWVSTIDVDVDYATTVVPQMVLMGLGLGLITTPATESIMQVLPPARAGVGSAVNDATRELGGTLGVAVVGSLFSSLYAARLAADHPDAFAEGRSLRLVDAIEYARRARGHRGRPSHGWLSLTPTEHRVTSLVAKGHTNEQVAERLLMSPTTVKTHLTHVFTKLGLANRTELAAAYANRD